MKARYNWTIGKYSDAKKYIDSYNNMKLENSSVCYVGRFSNLEALILRDNREYKKALMLHETEADSSSKFGNISRCNFLLGNLKDSLLYLKKSIDLLEDGNHVSVTNLGYAYFWCSDIMYKAELCEEGMIFRLLAKQIWNDVAPCLIKKLELDKYDLEESTIETIDKSIIEDVKNRIIYSEDDSFLNV